MYTSMFFSQFCAQGIKCVELLCACLEKEAVQNGIYIKKTNLLFKKELLFFN